MENLKPAMDLNDGEEAFVADGRATVRKAWEAVDSPPARENGRAAGDVVVPAAAAYGDDDYSVFPPSLHEGLHLRLDLVQEPFLGREDPGTSGDDGRERPVFWRRAVSESAEGIVRSVFVFIRSKIGRGVTDCSNSAATLTTWFAIVTLVGGALMYARRRRRHVKERALLLSIIKEKDQEIGHLLRQIALMSEVIAARHRVPVIRKT